MRSRDEDPDKDLADQINDFWKKYYPERSR